MTVRDALREGAATLRGSGTPFLDASLLLAAALGVEVGALYASGPEAIGEGTLDRYRSFLARRASGAPVAYILGYKEFWGRRFAVDERVLVPRPETELLVETAFALGDGAERERAGPVRVHEAFCGSACVAISIAADRLAWEVSASDISAQALAVAAANAAALLPADRSGGRPIFTLSDSLSAVDASFDLIVANPPYVPSAEVDLLLDEGWSEPRLALDGGSDGLEAYRRLVPEASRRLVPGGWLVVEADGAQAADLRGIFADSGFVDVDNAPDLAGIIRITRGRIPYER